jgi:peptidoglycan/LPS O-acetylase OafA/YrhL
MLSRGRARLGPTTDAGRPGSPPRHFDGFDGLRALAAMSVLMVHVSWASGFTLRSWFGLYTARLDIGVAVFFLISGFLLYRPFAVSHFSGTPARPMGTFWVRRALRIFPAYWLALTVLTFGFHLVSIGPGLVGVVSHYGLLQIYWPTESFNGIGQAWSLATEISFYLFLPFYALALGRRRRGAVHQLRFELIGIAVLLAVSNGFRWWVLNIPWVVLRHGELVGVCAPNCATDPTLSSLMVTWLPAYLDLFGLGMLLAVVSAWYGRAEADEPRWLGSRMMPYCAWGLALATYILIAHLPITRSPLYFATPAVNLLRQALYGVFALLLLLPAVFGQTQQSSVRAFLRSRPMVGLGLISYGIYLWHLNFADALVSWLGYKAQAAPMPLLAATTIGLTVAVASLSYVIIERPALRLKPRGRPKASAPS